MCLWDTSDAMMEPDKEITYWFFFRFRQRCLWTEQEKRILETAIRTEMSGCRTEVSMRKNSFGETVILVLMVIGIFLLVGMICDESAKNKCILKGCDNKRAPGSSYCYLHKSYGKTSSGSYTKSSGTKSSGSSYSGSKTKTSSSSYSGSKTKTSGSTYSGSSKKSSYYDSYDDGYDDVYMDGDYDYDRYDRDPDYADGVDDALDEFDGDW